MPLIAGLDCLFLFLLCALLWIWTFLAKILDIHFVLILQETDGAAVALAITLHKTIGQYGCVGGAGLHLRQVKKGGVGGQEELGAGLDGGAAGGVADVGAGGHAVVVFFAFLFLLFDKTKIVVALRLFCKQNLFLFFK
jgi:hypothetical protein